LSQKHRPSLSQCIAAQAPLAAKPAAQARVAEENKKPWLERPVDVPMGKHRHEQREARRLEMEQQLSAFADKQRRNSGRKNAKQPMGPTPQRAAKAIDGIVAETVIPGQGPVPPVRRHTVQSPIDRYGEFWDASASHGGRDLLQAARDLRDIFLLSKSSSRITSSYEGAATTKQGARHGGVADHIREAANIAEIIRAQFPACVDDIEFFLAEVVIHQDGTPMKFQDSGALISPWKTPDAQKGVGYGALYRTLQVLEWFLATAKQEGWGWGARSADPEVRKALAAEVRARAAIIRDKQARSEREAIADYVERERTENAVDVFVSKALKTVRRSTEQIMREKTREANEADEPKPQKRGK
jgi:hypothetical protein